MVYAVSIVPENAEIASRGVKSGNAANGVVRVGYACRVSIHRHAPHTLYALVLSHQFLDHIHVGAFGGHGNIYHLDTEKLGYREMSVVTGNGAEPLDLAAVFPRLRIFGSAEIIAARNGIVHYIKARVAENDNVFGVNAQHRRKKLLSLGNAVKSAVVEIIARKLRRVLRSKTVEHGHRKRELLGARLTARHVEFKSQRLVSFIFLLNVLLKSGKLLRAHIRKFHHKKPPYKHQLIYIILYSRRADFASIFCELAENHHIKQYIICKSACIMQFLQ